MTNPLSLAELEELYFRLSSAYGSPYSDDADAIHQSCLKLRAALQSGQTPETLLSRMQQLRRHTGQFKTKVSTVIADRYWNKQLTQPINATFYKPDEPVL